MQKNTASQKMIIFAFDRTDNTPVTGDAANITANLRKDNGSAVATNDVNPTETEDGFYAFDLTQAETNADVIQGFPASVTADVQVIAVPGVIYTTPTSFGDDVIQTGDGYAIVNDPVFGNSALNDSIGGLSTGSSAISIQAESYALTTGVQSSGTFNNTATVDSIYHEHTDTAGVLDLYYQFDVTGNGTASSTQIDLRINGANDSITVYAWDWVGAAWDQIDFLDGTNGSADTSLNPDLLIRHTGTGGDLGKVRVRFEQTGLTSATLRVDRIITSYAVVSQSVGYADGAIWVNTIGGAAGAVPFVNGVADNPVSTWADALLLSVTVGLKRFRITNGSTITLTASSVNFSILGDNWSLELGNQAISGIYVSGADSVTGIGTDGGTLPRFENSFIGDVSLPSCEFISCCLSGDFTATSAGDFYFVRCHSLVAGTATPSFDFGALNADQAVSFRGYSGGIEIKNMGQLGSDTMSLEGDGQLLINASCAGGAVAIRGNYTITDSAGGAVTLSQDARYDITRILSDGSPLNTTSGALDNVALVDVTTLNTDMVAAAPTTAAIWAEATRTLTSGVNIVLAKGVGVTGFTDLSAAQVNAEVLDVMVTDTFAEVTIPAATASIKDMIHYTFSRVRNKTTQTATTLTVRNDADSGNLGTATVSDDGTTFTKGEES